APIAEGGKTRGKEGGESQAGKKGVVRGGGGGGRGRGGAALPGGAPRRPADQLHDDRPEQPRLTSRRPPGSGQDQTETSRGVRLSRVGAARAGRARLVADARRLQDQPAAPPHLAAHAAGHLLQR